MGFPTISGALASQLTKFGGDIMNTIAQIFSGINAATSDSTNKPDINTDFRFRSGKFRFKDSSTPTPREINTTVANQTADRTINIPPLDVPVQDYVFTEENARLYNKQLNAADNNTFSNIPAASISGLSVGSLQNVGTGTGQVYKSVAALVASLKTIKAGSNITVTNNTDDITLTANPASIGGFMQLTAEVPSQSTTGTTYFSIGGSSPNATLTTRTIEVGMDLSVRSVRARVPTNTTNGSGLVLGIVDDGVVIASVPVAAAATGYFENDLSSPITIAAGSQIAISVQHTGSTGSYEIRPISIEVTSGLAGLGHKTSHVAGGSDPFVKGDPLNASARYLSAVGDPASDSSRFWINSPGLDIKYWDTQAVPVKQTLERQSNKGANSGYAPLDTSSLVPLANLGNITNGQISATAAIAASKLNLANAIGYNELGASTVDHTKVIDNDLLLYYRPTHLNYRTFSHAGGKGDAGEGLFNGTLVTQGTFRIQPLGAGAAPDWETGTTLNDQAGFRCTINITDRGQGVRIRGRIFVYDHTNSVGFFGLVNETAAFRSQSDPLNGKMGIGLFWNELSTQLRVNHNDGTGATIIDNFPTNITMLSNTYFDFEIRADPVNNRFQVLYFSSPGSQTFNVSTEIPDANTDLSFQCWIATRTAGVSKRMIVSVCEGVTRNGGGSLPPT
jgi:hypothetical protein